MTPEQLADQLTTPLLLKGHVDGRDERRRWASTVLGRDVPSFSTVTKTEAGRLIEWMEENWGTNA